LQKDEKNNLAVRRQGEQYFFNLCYPTVVVGNPGLFWDGNSLQSEKGCCKSPPDSQLKIYRNFQFQNQGANCPPENTMKEDRGATTPLSTSS
jgi:hypothetical protein